MDIARLFEGMLGFVIEEIIVGTIDFGILLPVIIEDIHQANTMGFPSTAIALGLLFVVILFIPVIIHLQDIKDAMG